MLPEFSGSMPMNLTVDCTFSEGEMQNRGVAQPQVIGSHITQEKLDDIQKLGLRIKYHEDNLNLLKSQINDLDESILDLQVHLGKYHSSSVSAVANNINHSQTEKETNVQILKQEKSAAGILCQLKARDGTNASEIPLTKDLLGIVATLGKVADDNINRLFAEYLGLDVMMAIVCKTYEDVKALEVYDEKGNIKTNLGLCGLGPSIGRQVDGRFLVLCLEDLRPYVGEFVEGDLQRKLALLKPKLPNGDCPPGFLGYAVNMVSLDSSSLSYVTASGHGLRETLFYHLFSRLQVYRTRGKMILARPFITDGALSLDGGMIRKPGVFFFGNRNEVEVRFPISTDLSNLPVTYLEAEQRLKRMKWEKERIGEDIKREESLLTHTKLKFASKKEEYIRLIANSTSFVNQISWTR